MLKNLFRILILLTGLLFLVSCSEEKTNPQTQSMPKVQVNAIEIQRKDRALNADYLGKALGYKSVEVRAQISGILKKRVYNEGDYVEAGELLFEIDPQIALAGLEQTKAKLQIAEADYARAEREYTRIQSLASKNAISQKDLDTARSNFESAKAQIEAAKGAVQESNINLQHTKVIAPISGYTSLDVRNEGNLITLDANGSLLTTINQTDPIVISFSLPANELQTTRRLVSQGLAIQYLEGEKVSLTMLDGQAYAHEGVISFVDTRIDSSTNVLRVRAEFPNPGAQIMPGEFATINVGGTKLTNSILLPQKAILQTAKGAMVYVLDAKNIASLRPVSLGIAIGQDFLVLGGLEPKDIVVVEGINKIIPGQEVEVNLLSDTNKE